MNMRGRIAEWLKEFLLEPILGRLDKLDQSGKEIMASIEQLQTEVNDATAAIAELKQATAAEKQEIAGKLDTQDTKIAQLTNLVEQLKTQGEVPESLLSELADATASIRQTTSEIKAIVDTPTA